MVTSVIADSKDANLAEIKAKVEATKGCYLLEWDRASLGNGFMLFYRNMVIRPDYAHSISQMQTMPLDGSAINPLTMIANFVIGEYGPMGKKYPSTYFVSEQFDFDTIRKLQ